MTIGIYKIQNLVNNKVYIGQSVHIERRWSEHCQPSSNSVIARAIKEYGKENFSFEILEQCLIEELDYKEEYYIHLYNSVVPNGYNVTDIIDGTHTMCTTIDQQTIQSIIQDIQYSDKTLSDIANDYDVSLRTIIRINQGHTHFNSNLSYPLRLQKEYASKLCSQCGKPVSQKATLCKECYEKQFIEPPERDELLKMVAESSFVAVGEKFGVSDNTIKNWCQRRGLPRIKADLINVYRIEILHLPPVEKKIKQQVEQIDPITNNIIATFKSTREATSVTKIDHIKEVCDGKRNSAGGFIWRYKNS